MTDVRILLAFAALLVLALVLVERGIPSAVAPLCAVAITMLFFSLLGSFGLLVAAGWVFYALMIAGAGYLVYRLVVQHKKLPRLGMGFWFFVLASLLVIGLFWVRKPMFLTWDEFSFWGTAAKLTKVYNEFYSTAPVGWGWPATSMPGLISLSYFAQFFGREFVEWQVYAIYDVLLFSAMAAMTLPLGRRHWNIAFPVLITGLLVPFIFTQFSSPAQLSSVYLDSLSDTPMGLLFGAALACWFGAEQHDWKGVLPACLATAALALTKDIAMALGLIVAVLAALDLLSAKREKALTHTLVQEGESVVQTTPERPTLKTKLLGVAGRFGLLAGCAVLPFMGWSMHLSATSGVSKLDLGGANNMGMLEMPLAFLEELLSPEKSDKFLEVMRGTPWQLVHTPVSLFGRLGTGVVLVALMLGMTAVAAAITRSAAHRRRTIVFGVFSLLGFAAYTLFISMCYIYIFRAEQTFASYERYMMPYYIGWFMGALTLLGMCARDARFTVEGRAAVLGLCLLFCVQCARALPPAYTVLGFDPDEYAERRADAEAHQLVAARLPEDSLTYFLSTDDSGLKWFTYIYDLLPKQLHYSAGGGPPAVRDKAEDGSLLPPRAATRAEWEGQLRDGKVDFVFLEHADEDFRKTYGSLFADGMDGYFDDGVDLYAAEETSRGLTLKPVE